MFAERSTSYRRPAAALNLVPPCLSRRWCLHARECVLRQCCRVAHRALVLQIVQNHQTAHHTTVQMKVVALISGGKDSFMSLDMCQQDGHQARGLSTSMRALE